MTGAPPAEVAMDEVTDKNAATASNARENVTNAGESSCLDCCSDGMGGCLCFSVDCCMNFSQWFNDCCSGGW